MASNGSHETFAVPNVLAAMLTMRSGDNEKKKAAVDYLGRFQKSVGPSPLSPGAAGADLLTRHRRTMPGPRRYPSSRTRPKPRRSCSPRRP